MSDEQIHQDEPKPARPPFLVRFGGTVGAATLASLLGSSPAAFRLSAASGMDLFRAWLLLAGLAVAPMLVLVPLARLAREGLRGLRRGDGSRALSRVAAAMFFFCTWIWFDSLLGAVLREKTHHRALGGVTFALVVLGAGVFLAFVARRLAAILGALRWPDPPSARRRAVGTAACVAVLALSVGILGLRVARAAPQLSAEGRAALVDGLALALALAFFARKAFEDRRLVARLGPPAAFILLVLAMHGLATSQTAGISMVHASPVHFALLRLFAKLSL